MAINNPYSKYKSLSINTATPQELTLMLYDGCIKFMLLAQEGFKNKNYEQINTNLIKAQNIITELDITLNDNYEISKNMHLLYDFAESRLIEANISKTIEPIFEAQKIITDLRDAWKEAMVIARKGQ